MTTLARWFAPGRFAARILRLAQSSLTIGTVAGIWILASWNVFTAQLGASPVACGSALIVLAVGLDLGIRRRTQTADSRIPSNSALVATLTLAIWTACLPLIVNLAVGSSQWWTVDRLASDVGSLLFHLTASIAAWLCPAWCVGFLAAKLCADSTSTPIERSRRMGRILLSAALAALGVSFLAAPWLSLQLIASVATALLAARCLMEWMEARSCEPASDRETPAAATPSVSLSSERFTGGRSFALCAAFGLLVGICRRQFAQLLINSEPMDHLVWIGLLLGAAIAMAVRIRRGAPRRGDEIKATEALMPLAWTVVVVAAFPLFLEIMLTMNAGVTSVWLLVPCRILLAVAVFAPLGAGIGNELSRSVGNRRGLPAGLCASTIAGYVLFAMLRGRDHALTASLMIAAVGSVALSLPVLKRDWLQGSRLGRGAMATALIIAGFAPWAPLMDQPARAARMLFSTNVLVARQNGVQRRLLPSLDESRLVGQTESSRAVFTLWQSRGAQAQLRENGVPRGYLSLAPAVLPQFTGELTLAALPMTLHEAPHRVLILGTGGGLPLMTALAFPAKHVECVEPDAKLVSLLSKRAWPQGDASPLNDERLAFRYLEPALALTARSDRWDVVLSNPPQSSTSLASSEFTREFYQRAAARLADGGIFCQRFAHVDYGPQPVLSAVKTMQAAFSEVIAVEAASGELLLLGTNSPAGIVRSGFVERLQTGHVRQVLAQAGWDWSILLGLTAYDASALQELAANAVENTASNGRFAFRLPLELMRWSDKWSETASALSAKATRLIAWPTLDGNDPELLARLSEVAGQRNLMTSYADQPWIYRKSLREQMKKTKSSLIRQASAISGEMHPVDEQRKQYFEALGRCLQQENPTDEDLTRLEATTAPYDPLMSYFSHYELAELYARQSPPNTMAELEHRLHMAWYADPRDPSVRPITRSLEILAAGDDLPIEPAMRWDQMNGLLQLLLSRWEVRGTAKPVADEVALKDLQRSLSGAEAAMDAMDELAAKLELTEAEWDARRTVLEKAVIRPLRTYQSRLLPRVMNQELKTRQLLQKAGVVPESQTPEPVDPGFGF